MTENKSIKKERILPFFVYGTLMEGFSNFATFLDKYKPIVRPAVLLEHVLLAPHSRAAFPYMANWNAVFNCSGHHNDFIPMQVLGQLVELEPKDFPEALERLDALEGVPDHYQRKIVTVILAGEERRDAYCYYLPDEYVPHMFYNPIINSGSWKEFTNART